MSNSTGVEDDSIYIQDNPDKWIGLSLAISSSLLIGISFILTKKGLQQANVKERGKLKEDLKTRENSRRII